MPGHRFDTHSVAHNIINMTPIPAELDLAAAGLTYQEMDPFAVAVRADGRIVRFHRDVERTVASIAEHDPAEARAYAAFARPASATRSSGSTSARRSEWPASCRGRAPTRSCST